MKLRIGDRVQVRAEHGWPQCPTGTVTALGPTTFGGGFFGLLRQRWRVMRGSEPVIVKFDVAQTDADGVGPCPVAAIHPAALVRLA